MTDMNSSLCKSALVLGWDLMCALHDKSPCDAALSPLSVSFALGMLAGGATGNAQKELCSKLGINNADELKCVFSALLEVFGSGSNREMLAFANALFTDQSFTVNPRYLRHVEAFRAHVKSDFPSLLEGKDQINDWISEKTNGMIENMLTAQALGQAHVALVNALAFKGIWKNKFKTELTMKNYSFRLSAGTTRPTDMMLLQGPEVLLYKGSGYTAVQLPYTASSVSSTMSFIAYLPDENQSLRGVLDQLRHQDIPVFSPTRLTQLGFPKLKITTAVDIFPLLQALGCLSSNDFPELGNGPNRVDSILHNAAVNLDEHGTEAAAATVVLMRRGGLQHSPTLIYDRPFAFSIIVNATALTVFVGVFTGE
jgi:serine protease inhibitor